MRDSEPQADKSDLQYRRVRRVKSVLRKLARSGDAKKILRDDPRLGQSVRRISKHATSLAEAAAKRLEVLDLDADPTLSRDLSAVIRRIRVLKTKKADDDLEDICRHAGTPRNVAAMMRYFGFDGRGGATLEVVGQRIGVTRERARQIIKKVTEVLPASSFVPGVERALRAACRLLPEKTGVVSSELCAAGLLARTFDVRGLCAANEYFKRNFDIDILPGSEQVVCRANDRSVVGPFLVEARVMCSHDGAGNIANLVHRLSLDAREFSEDRVATLLSADPEVRWLEEKSWFYFPTARNRFRNYLLKMLAVAPSLDPSEIRAGIGRSHRIDIAPPKRVILALCRQFPEFVETDGRISLASGGLAKSLSGIELTLSTVLFAHNGICAREVLEKECLEAGINRNSFYQYLAYSPIIERLAEGVYALRGTSVPPGLVEDLRRRVHRKGNVLVDYGWKDGRVWFGYCVSAGMIRSGVFSVPAAFSEIVSGEFVFRDVSGTLTWSMKTGENAGWSLSKLLSATDMEAGDYLVLLFDVRSRTGVAYLGTQELLFDFSADAPPRDTDGLPELEEDGLDEGQTA